MKLKTLAWTAAATAATAAAGGVAADPQGSWYLKLHKPDWQPPALAFPVVWTGLYADLAAAAEAAVLVASSADLVRRTYRLNRAAGVSLAPYAAWCGFATVLSTAIARLNPAGR